MEQLLTYLPDVLTWSNLLVLVCGSIGGLFFGAMPGLSPTMAVALLVPFTFYMPPVPSLLSWAPCILPPWQAGPSRPSC